ncbi:acyl-CoA dehydrogenase family protein [Streptomyces palmae]|uniref:Acyl-CoA dehydrogenase n=1 Tax=Streptomyces palmae TaxID=1701085 RepID=A0A4Z0GTT6_9ACTN|nr:acyl-CoA dehydrogenase family protein [Streptomyces palmae]TGA99722.1 acyl-CoA dehydrogenase [Streptomyces palmae]
MRFALDAEQTEFGHTLGRLLSTAEVPATVRSWAAGDFAAGRVLWRRLAAAGVFALAVPEEYAGLGRLPVELAVACEELGRYAVPGPVVETVAGAMLLGALAGHGKAARAAAEEWLPRIADGRAMVTLGAPEAGPYVLDAEAADTALVYDGRRLFAGAGCGPARRSVDPARRLHRPGPGGLLLAVGAAPAAAVRDAGDWAAFATAAQCLGVGLALLERTVEHVRRRTQFGRPIGSFQAVKHRLADVLIDLEFTRPLLYGAAVALAAGAPTAGAEVAAAKAAAGEAVYRAARAALQLHGAIGYTQELDLSLWLGKARALRGAWGAPGRCRARALAGLV